MRYVAIHTSVQTGRTSLVPVLGIVMETAVQTTTRLKARTSTTAVYKSTASSTSLSCHVWTIVLYCIETGLASPQTEQNFGFKGPETSG